MSDFVNPLPPYQPATEPPPAAPEFDWSLLLANIVPSTPSGHDEVVVTVDDDNRIRLWFEGVSDGNKGDITVSGGGTVWTIASSAITTDKMGGDVTAAGKTLLTASDASEQRNDLGLGSMATVSPTGTPDGTKFLRDDYSWQSVAGGSGLTHQQVLARGLGA